MKLSEFFIKRWEAEQPAFSKVLRAMPEGKLSHRPHERSTAAGDLAWQLAEEQRVLVDVLDRGSAKWDARPTPDKASDIAAAWDKATTDLRARLAKLDEAKYDSKASLAMGDGPAWSDTVGNMLWGFLFDMVHHRGQLSSYLRPMGGKVPAIYGPSADDQG